MAQPSVAREPSMEEILASIRKIIESNEPGASQSISASLPPVYEMSEEEADDIRLTIDDDLAAAELNDIPPVPTPSPVAAGADPRFVAANSAGPQPAPEGRTMSLADVAARVRAASERNAAQPVAARENPPQRELPPGMAARFAEVRFSQDESQPVAAVVQQQPAPEVAMRETSAPEPVSIPMNMEESEAVAQMEHVVVPMRLPEREPEAEAQAAPQPQVSPEQYQPAPSVEAAAQPSHARVVAPMPAFAEAPQARPQPAPAAREADVRFLPQVQEEFQKTLLSAAAGEQVARSFDELAAALGQEHRSLDEIAEDMLRPMLQEWLDDNLPMLVERLVREEIERVARGPRR